MTYRLGVDVGGTFTDFLLIDESTGDTRRLKVPSTPSAPGDAVVQGVDRICSEFGPDPSEITHFLHGTTVATNAVLERRGASVGLMVTAGHREVIHIARSFVPGGLGGWIVWDRPDPLVRLETTFEITERISAHGEVVTDLDEASVARAIEALRSSGVDAITVCLMNAYANPAHEERVRDIVAQRLPDVPVSISSDILPEIGEYERALTTVANSYVRPMVGRYLDDLRAELEQRGVSSQLRVLRSDGGLMQFGAATAAPVNLLMSGPAGGVAAATWLASQAGQSNQLTLDMGGTSTDVALILDGAPALRRETQIGDLVVRSASVDVQTVGAGGGSIAHVPELTGALRVGPESAGADPGPAAYGLGGQRATVTDANVVLGYLPSGLLGGDMTLDADAARAAVGEVARALRVDVHEAAAAIYDVVNESMLGAMRLVSVQKGHDPRDFALAAFGGAGPLHANALGRLIGAWPVIIPPSPGVLCAYGDATTGMRSEAARSFIRRFGQTSQVEVAAELQQLADQVQEELAAAGVPEDQRTITYQIDVRYHGQGFQVPVTTAIRDGQLDGGLDAVATRFNEAHERLYSFFLDEEHETVNLRAAGVGPRPDVRPAQEEAATGPVSDAQVGANDVFIDGRWSEAGIFDRAALRPGHRIDGPAIIAEMDSTTLVLPAHVAALDDHSNILIRPRAMAGDA